MTRDLLSIEATIHSENSISPFPSRSTSSKIACTSFWDSSLSTPKPFSSSSLVIFPVYDVLIALKAFSSSLTSSWVARLLTMYSIVACCSLLPVLYCLSCFMAKIAAYASALDVLENFLIHGSCKASLAEILRSGSNVSNLSRKARQSSLHSIS